MLAFTSFSFYAIQKVTANINRRAVSPHHSLVGKGIQDAQKAKLSQLRHLSVKPGGELQGALHSST